MECTFRLEDAEIVDVWISRCWQGIQVEISSRDRYMWELAIDEEVYCGPQETV